MGRQDKGVPRLLLGSRGWNIWGSSAPSLYFIPETVYVSLIYPGQCFSWPTVVLFLPSFFSFLFIFLSLSLKISVRESEMGNIKMDEYPVETVTADGDLFCLKQGFGTWHVQ